MKGDYKYTWLIPRKKKNPVEYRVYETACESCRFRYTLSACRESKRARQLGLKEPCVLTCTGYEFMEWTDEMLKEARAKINETRYEADDHYSARKESLKDELFDDYEEKKKKIQGFDYKEEDDD